MAKVSKQRPLWPGFKKCFSKKPSPVSFLGFIGFFWVLGFIGYFWRGFKVGLSSAKCYSHQANPEMQN